MSAASSSITYLAIVNGETQWQSPLYDFDAVVQAIMTRLNLFQGEWWANLADGTPMWQSILAQAASPAAQQQMGVLIGARILGSPFVTELQNVSISYNPTTRAFSYSANAITSFGTVPITNFPIPAIVQGVS